nr:MAG: major capsid protein [Microvirus Sku12]
MANPFTAQSERNNNVRRDLHDLSFQWNGSIPFGRRNVVLCQEVLPGQSVRIKPTFGLRTLPLVFPTQTRVRAALHFFYVRNRLLWKDWQDFIFHTKDGLVPPTIAKNSRVSFATGSLSDALGVPTTVYTPLDLELGDKIDYRYNVSFWRQSPSNRLIFYSQPKIGLSEQSASLLNVDFPEYVDSAPTDKIALYLDVKRLAPLFQTDTEEVTINYVLNKSSFTDEILNTQPNGLTAYGYDSYGRYLSSPYAGNKGIIVRGSEVIYSFLLRMSEIRSMSYDKIMLVLNFPKTVLNSRGALTIPGLFVDFNRVWKTAAKYTFTQGIDLSLLPAANNPFLNGQRPLSALPYRAYEFVYNAFYRNQQIDPFKINGQAEYNKFITNDDGGEDSVPYDFFNSYWEMDAFTSCLTAPQQGPTPMVGVYPAANGSQQIAFKDEDGNVRNVTPHMSEDGKTLLSMDVTDVKGDITLLDTRAAFEQGFVINDLRNVNALQKYLEMSQRKGYRYRDLMAGHYDVDIRYDELNYPEFLGGNAKDMYVNTVVATARTNGSVDAAPVELGDYAGNAGVAGDCAPITKYCDEHGFIIGILTVTPVPVYTQTLKPMFTRLSHLDYFTPEFSNIGMQPLPKDMLAPLEYYLSKDRTGLTFGYQQPWWSYKRNLDEAHGLYRNQLRGFLLHRVFKDMPKLGKDFITCDPTQLNDIFATSFDNSDKLFGEIYFDIETKSPVPFISVASIE